MSVCFKEENNFINKICVTDTYSTKYNIHNTYIRVPVIF